MFLELTNIEKMFDADNGVKHINLSLDRGQFLTLLGPSGCGKTTTLNCIGGFLKPDQGTIQLDGQDITRLPPEERPISTVFQSYALFPHLNVLENVCFGLRHLSKRSKEEARQVAQEYLAIVGLTDYAKSSVGQLSGGQQQRVALARSMATKPKLLLLDEPLSNLDASLRVSLRKQLKSLQQQLGITMILVTHDQEEAFSLSDQVVVMGKGVILQQGKPEEIYYQPINSAVANMVGRMNLPGEIRPSDLRLTLSENSPYIVKERHFKGAVTEYVVSDGTITWEVELMGRRGAFFEVGQRVDLLKDT